jgi:hypothetical protein
MRSEYWRSALGARRGPATEARLLYEEAAPPVRLSELAPKWMTPLADASPNAQISGTLT